MKITSIDPKDPSIDRAVISLNVRRGSKGDLKGKVALSDVWLARLPRISVSTNCPFNVYSNPKDVVVNCELSGIRERDPEIRFQLMDTSSREVHGDSVHLDGRLIVEDTKKASDIVDGIGSTPAGYEGSTQWRPTIPGYGLYSVNVKMLSSDASGKHTDQERKWIAAWFGSPSYRRSPPPRRVNSAGRFPMATARYRFINCRSYCRWWASIGSNFPPGTTPPTHSAAMTSFALSK